MATAGSSWPAVVFITQKGEFMALDKNGNEIKVDDHVTIACVVTGVEPDDGSGVSKIHVQTFENFAKSDFRTNVKLSSSQVALADALFDEKVPEKEAMAQFSAKLYPSDHQREAVAPSGNEAVDAAANLSVRKSILQSNFSVLGIVLGHQSVRKAVKKALAAGVSWADILSVVIPMVISFVKGGPIDWAAIVAAITALISPASSPATAPHSPPHPKDSRSPSAPHTPPAPMH